MGPKSQNLTHILHTRSLENLTSDWNNGINLAHLVDALAPGSWDNMESVSPDTANENVRKGLKLGNNVVLGGAGGHLVKYERVRHHIFLNFSSF